VPRVVFVFLDGVGLGPADDYNPFNKAHLPAIQHVLDTPLIAGAERARPGLLLTALDALLGVDGIPQSATGQAALFTGINVVRQLGYHLPAYPNAILTKLLHDHSILRQATDRGYRATFANAYSPLYFEMVKREKRRMSATTHSVLGANLPFRWLEDLKQGQAVYWDVTNEQLVARFGIDIPIITPEQAGRNLAGLSRNHDLVLYESFLPDLIGHRRQMDEAIKTLELLDRFLGSLWANVTPDTTVVLCSDHGNIEDLSSGCHTTNPVPLLVKGPGAVLFEHARSLIDVATPIVTLLEEDGTHKS
jgi:2,3-bisphosphoglycerate-independent phosphoglycerate mutase